MTDQTVKAEQFRALHIPGKPLVLYNIWDPASAQAVAASEAQAIATSSWAVAKANGFEDGERMPLALALDNLKRVVAVTDLPVTVDLESGYGDGPEVFAETVRLAIQAGAVGCNLEDSFPANGKLRETSDHAARLRHARQIADATGIRFFMNARTDIFFQKPAEQHDKQMAADAITRAHAYADAGADGFFVPGLEDLALIRRVAEASPLPINIMAGSVTPPLRTLAELGVARVSYGASPYLLAMKELENAARKASQAG